MLVYLSEADWMQAVQYDTGQSLRGLAQLTGVPYTTLQGWRTGTRIPRLHQLQQLVNATGVELVIREVKRDDK